MIEWALNSATLAQFFMEQNAFRQARHHLSAASYVLDKHDQELQTIECSEEELEAKKERLKHRGADVARCWAKYGIVLLSTSRDRLMEAEEGQSGDATPQRLRPPGELSGLQFSLLELSVYEDQVTDSFVLTYDDARTVFLNCQQWLGQAKLYYTLDDHASDHVRIIQDYSELYRNLVFFEDDEERQCKMHKRRVDLLEGVVKELNPTYFLTTCQELWFELGETYTAMVDIKLSKLESSEESLIVAAKIGSALLQENNYLKNENRRLQDKLNSLEAKVEELENCEGKYVAHMERLQEKISELEAQLTKEKLYVVEAQTIFEDHDGKQIELIKDYENKIEELESKIMTLQQHTPEKTERRLRTTGTQTLAPDYQTNNTFPSVLLEIGLLKNSHNAMEEKFKSLEAIIKNLTLTKNAEECTYRSKSPSHKHKRYHNNARKPVVNKKEENKFSVSLQVQKMKAATSHAENLTEGQTPKTITTPPPIKIKEPYVSTCPSRTGKEPPITARIRPVDEDLEDFFRKHIDF
ncbi:hypothetical protein J6590_045292 [Homalodisca vitripennis]|nr:hypothetical protein J6590_045292 [Homalodisca vitripennis]